MESITELLAQIRSALNLDTHAAQLYDAVRDQNSSGAWWAFGRNTDGRHCLFLAFPLSDEQIKGLETRDVLLSESGFAMARNALKRGGGRLS